MKTIQLCMLCKKKKIVNKMTQKWNQDFHEILQGWKGNEDVNIELVENVKPSLTSLTSISYHMSISVDKGWDYGHEDNIWIINLHNLMIRSNKDYEN